MADPFAEYVVPVSDPFAPYAVPGSAPAEATRTPATSKPQWGDQSMPLAQYLKPALPFLGGTVLPAAAMAAFAPEGLLAKLALSAGASAVGAGGGSLAGDVATGRPPNLGRAGREAALYGGSTLVGEGALAPAARSFGDMLRLAAVRPTAKLLEAFPGLEGRFLSTRLPVNAEGRVAAAGARKVAGRAERSLLRSSPATVTADKLTGGLGGLADALRKQPTSEADMGALKNFWDEFLSNRMTPPGPPVKPSPFVDQFGAALPTPAATPRAMVPMNANDVKDMIQAAGQITKSAKTARAGGQLVGAEQATTAAANEAVENSGRQWLRENVPGWKEAAAKTQGAIGVSQMLRRASNLRSPVALPYLPPAVQVFVPRFLRSPAITDATGRLLSNAKFQTLTKQAPKVATFVLQELMASHAQPDTTQ